MYLNAHSYFSLRYGVLSPQQLVAAARNSGIQCLALTDINNTSAALGFVRACQEQGVKPVLGIEFRNEAGRLLYVGLARNNAGWAALCAFLTDHSLNSKALPETAPELEHTYFIYDRIVKPMGMLRPNEFLGIRSSQVHGLYQHALNAWLDRLVVWQPITFLDHEGFRLHKLLRAIDLNTLVTKLKQEDIAHSADLIQPEAELLQMFQLYPKIIENTRNILDSCSIRFETGLQLNRRSFTGSKDGDLKLLAKLAYSGCIRRYGEQHRPAQERMRKELKVIGDLDFGAYFLITWDIVRYAQSAGYYHVGRGSGANSIVAYCLFITDVDPLELDLYFERFINPRRTSPPDFDIDFSWDERDDVTDYIFKRYGREHTALLATYNTFQHHAIVRELGKAFGLPKKDIDLISDNLPALVEWSMRWTGRKDREDAAPARTQPAQEADALYAQLHPWAKYILIFGQQLLDFPNYLSIHAGGVLISEKPLSEYTALQQMPKGFPITHFDMYGAEDWGFHKFDVLSQRGLGHIKDTIDLVRKNQGKAVEIHDVERIKQDPKVRDQLRSGRCIGCFYIESPAMRGLLHKLRCDNYIHLVAASSIIRPGVAQSGMMRAYIQRFHQPNGFDYLHPVFREHLGETFGVMVYQEDVMKILHHFAGLGLDEADVMRRMMTGKKRSSSAFERLKQQYFDNCAQRGYPDELTREVWRQIESFAGYSFCKAHSASFAVESFQSLYLKTYFPLEFMVGVINNFGGFYQTEYYVHEARMSGARVHAPDINRSGYLTHIEGSDIYLGFVHLKGFEQQNALHLVTQRKQYGPFRSLEDFIRRVNIARSQLELLIRIGAFRFTGLSKTELLWERNRVMAPAEKNVLHTPTLFGDESPVFQLPQLDATTTLDAFDEMELLGFPLCSPFELLTPEEKAQGLGLCAADLPQHLGRRVMLVGYYVCRKDTRTIKGQRMHFGTWIDQNGAFFDTVHFPRADGQVPFRGRGLYRIRGLVMQEFGFLSIETTQMERLAFFTGEE